MVDVPMARPSAQSVSLNQSTDYESTSSIKHQGTYKQTNQPTNQPITAISVHAILCRDVFSVLTVSVSRVWKNRTAQFRLSLKGSMSWSCLGLEDITSRSWVSGFVTLGLVNIHAMHQACGYIRKKIMDLTRKKQVVK